MKLKTLGHIGQRYACEYLESQGYVVCEQNWTVQGGEIDIIAEKQGVIHAVEVKTMTTYQEEREYDYISPAQQKALQRSFEIYIESFLEEKEYQIDLILVVIEKNRDNTYTLLRIEYFTDVVESL